MNSDCERCIARYGLPEYCKVMGSCIIDDEHKRRQEEVE